MKTLFKQLKREYQSYQTIRSKIKKEADDALNKSKRAIFSLQRDNFEQGEKLIDEAEKHFHQIEKQVKKEPKLVFEGFYQSAREEYVEAKLFWQLLKKGKIGLIKEVKLFNNDYLGGISDLTGEMVRQAISLATQRDYLAVEKIKEKIEQIVNQLIQFNLTGYLRNKGDAAKRNLRKLEEILYEIKTRNLE